MKGLEHGPAKRGRGRHRRGVEPEHQDEPHAVRDLRGLQRQHELPRDRLRHDRTGAGPPLEVDALAKQNDLPGAKAENVAADLRRVLMMRTLVQRAIDPDRIGMPQLKGARR